MIVKPSTNNRSVQAEVQSSISSLKIVSIVVVMGSMLIVLSRNGVGGGIEKFVLYVSTNFSILCILIYYRILLCEVIYKIAN